MSSRFLLIPIAAMTILAAACTAATTDAGAADTEAAARTTVAVTRGNLNTEREFRATVSFGEPWDLNTTNTGTITQQHDIGAVVGFGETLLRIDDRPLFLAEGEMPMYRTLLKARKKLEGFDVAQLQFFLIEAGYDDGGALVVDGVFGDSTEDAVEDWQEAVGLPKTGSVDNTQIVFAPEPLRIASQSRVGAAFSNLQVNNADPAVLVDTSNRDRGVFVEGDKVVITLPDESDFTGAVAAQEQTTDAAGAKVWRTTIEVGEGLPGDASSATVIVTEVVAEDVLLVPVGTLLALAEGGFAVEIETDTDSTTRLVAVEVGEVLDGQAEVSGEISAGDRVVTTR